MSELPVIPRRGIQHHFLGLNERESRYCTCKWPWSEWQSTKGDGPCRSIRRPHQPGLTLPGSLLTYYWQCCHKITFMLLISCFIEPSIYNYCISPSLFLSPSILSLYALSPSFPPSFTPYLSFKACPPSFLLTPKGSSHGHYLSLNQPDHLLLP